MAKISYARVSTLFQNANLQIDALKKSGCRILFTDQDKGG